MTLRSYLKSTMRADCLLPPELEDADGAGGLTMLPGTTASSAITPAAGLSLAGTWMMRRPHGEHWESWRGLVPAMAALCHASTPGPVVAGRLNPRCTGRQKSKQMSRSVSQLSDHPAGGQRAWSSSTQALYRCSSPDKVISNADSSCQEQHPGHKARIPSASDSGMRINFWCIS